MMKLAAWQKGCAVDRMEQSTSTSSLIVEEEFKEMENKILKSLQEMSVDVIEVYSAPRATTAVKKFGMIMGKMMDIITGWDFNKENKAMEYIGKHKSSL